MFDGTSHVFNAAHCGDLLAAGASGSMSKRPMASIDGVYVEQKGLPSFDGAEVSFNPKRVYLFVDSQNRPIQYAQDVTVLGHRAYARGWIVYYGKDNEPKRAGRAHSEVRFHA